MVAWFAAIFFLGRMYIYRREALEKEPSDKSIITLCEGAEKRTIFIILMLGFHLFLHNIDSQHKHVMPFSFNFSYTYFG